MLNSQCPALILAPMQGLTDAPMRAVCAGFGAFTFSVSEFLRVSSEVPPARVFLRHVPELLGGGCTTPNGLPVQVQILGGDAGRMARAAVVACQAGAAAVDINFGCPAPTVNRHDGGAMLLNHPERIREIVRAVRDALPPSVPVSAKLRLGWDTPDTVRHNAEMAAQGGASWIAIHGRTRMQGYTPPALWHPIGQVRQDLDIPVVANGDIWTLADFQRCRDETGCAHFMLGRGALADPRLPRQVAHALGIAPPPINSMEEPEPTTQTAACTWRAHLQALAVWTERIVEDKPPAALAAVLTCRFKQWLKLAERHGNFSGFERVKRARTPSEVLDLLSAPAELADADTLFAMR